MEDNADRADNCLSELDFRLSFAPNGHASMCSNLISKQRQNDEILLLLFLCNIDIKLNKFLLFMFDANYNYTRVRVI